MAETPESNRQLDISAAAIANYIDLAVAKDQRIAQAGAAVAASEAGVDTVAAPRLPQVRASGGYSWTEQQEPLEQGYNNAEVALDVEQSLWQRNLRSQTQLAEIQSDAARIGVRQATETLLRELSSAFFDLLNQRRLVAAYDAQLQSLQNARERAEARFDAGVISLPQVTSVRAEYNQIQALLVAAEALQATYQDILERLTGVQVVLPQEEKTPQLAMPQGDAQTWEKRARDNNLALQLAGNAITQADLGVTLAKRSNDITLGLFGRWAHASDPVGQGNENQYQQVGVRLNIPLYTGGGVAASATVAEQNYLSAQLQRDYLVSLLGSEVRLKWRQLQSQLAVIEANELSALSASQSLQLNQVAYANNAVGQQELLDAQSRFYDARRVLVASQYAFSRQLVDLYVLAGDLDKSSLLEIIGEWI